MNECIPCLFPVNHGSNSRILCIPDKISAPLYGYSEFMKEVGLRKLSTYWMA